MSEAARGQTGGIPSPEDLLLTQSGKEIAEGQSERQRARERLVSRQRLVWDHRQTVFRTALAAALLSSLVAFLIPARYQSTARLMPPDEPNLGAGLLAASRSNIGAPLGSDLGSTAGDLLGLKNSSDLFIGILQSRTVQDDLIRRFGLLKIYSESRIEDARKELAKHTEISADRKSGIITIAVEDHQPERAAAMMQEYVGELNRVVTQLNTSSAHREREFLEERLAQVKQNLESAENSFSDFATKNTALDIPNQGKTLIEGMAALEGQLVAAEAELQEFKQIYADGSVQVKAIQAKVDKLSGELEKTLGAKDGKRISVDGSGPQSLFPNLRQLPELGVSYADLFRSTKIQEAVFQTLTQEYEIAKVEEAKETPSVKVLDPPDVPDEKSYPPRLAIIAVCTALAAAGSILMIFGKNRWDHTDEGDPQKAFANEVLGAVWSSVRQAGASGSLSAQIGSRVWGRFRGRRKQSNPC